MAYIKIKDYPNIRFTYCYPDHYIKNIKTDEYGHVKIGTDCITFEPFNYNETVKITADDNTIDISSYNSNLKEIHVKKAIGGTNTPKEAKLRFSNESEIKYSGITNFDTGEVINNDNNGLSLSNLITEDQKNDYINVHNLNKYEYNIDNQGEYPGDITYLYISSSIGGINQTNPYIGPNSKLNVYLKSDIDTTETWPVNDNYNWKDENGGKLDYTGKHTITTIKRFKLKETSPIKLKEDSDFYNSSTEHFDVYIEESPYSIFNFIKRAKIREDNIEKYDFSFSPSYSDSITIEDGDVLFKKPNSDLQTNIKYKYFNELVPIKFNIQYIYDLQFSNNVYNYDYDHYEIADDKQYYGFSIETSFRYKGEPTDIIWYNGNDSVSYGEHTNDININWLELSDRPRLTYRILENGVEKEGGEGYIDLILDEDKITLKNYYNNIQSPKSYEYNFGSDILKLKDNAPTELETSTNYDISEFIEIQQNENISTHYTLNNIQVLPRNNDYAQDGIVRNDNNQISFIDETNENGIDICFVIPNPDNNTEYIAGVCTTIKIDLVNSIGQKGNSFNVKYGTYPITDFISLNNLQAMDVNVTDNQNSEYVEKIDENYIKFKKITQDELEDINDQPVTVKFYNMNNPTKDFVNIQFNINNNYSIKTPATDSNLSHVYLANPDNGHYQLTMGNKISINNVENVDYKVDWWATPESGLSGGAKIGSIEGEYVNYDGEFCISSGALDYTFEPGNTLYLNYTLSKVIDPQNYIYGDPITPSGHIKLEISNDKVILTDNYNEGESREIYDYNNLKYTVISYTNNENSPVSYKQSRNSNNEVIEGEYDFNMEISVENDTLGNLDDNVNWYIYGKSGETETYSSNGITYNSEHGYIQLYPQLPTDDVKIIKYKLTIDGQTIIPDGDITLEFTNTKVTITDNYAEEQIIKEFPISE